MDKKYLIAGGAGVILIGIVVYAKMNNNEAPTQSAPQTEVLPSMGYFSGMAPTSGGISGGGGGGSILPGNSGASEVGGGMDMVALMEKMFAGQTEVNKLSVITNGHNYDSAVLASIVGINGTATVSHSSTGTSITNTPGADAYEQIINDIYKQELNRAPDKGGLAYWKNALMNNNVSVGGVNTMVKNSSEALASKPVNSQYTPGVAGPWSPGMIDHVNSGGSVGGYNPPPITPPRVSIGG